MRIIGIGRKGLQRLIKARDIQVLKNMASSWGAFLTGMVIFFFLTPYMRRNMGEGTTGVWYLLANLTSYIGWIRFGLMTGLTKHVAEYHAQNNREKLLAAIHSALVLAGLLSLLILAAGLLLFRIADWIPALQKTDMPRHVKYALLLIVINMAVNLPLALGSAVLAGLQRYDFNNLILTIGTLLQASGFIFVIHQGYGLTGLALCQMLVAVLVNLVSFHFLNSLYSLTFSFRYIQPTMIRLLFSFGLYGVLMNIGNFLTCQVAPILIGILLNDASIFYFAIALKLLEFLESFTREAINVLLPVASEISTLQGETRTNKIFELMTRGSRFSALLSLPPIIFMAVFGESFLSAWQGPSFHYSRTSYLVLLILAVPYLLKISLQIAYPMIFGLGVHKFSAALIWIASAAVNLIFSFILGKLWGIFGIAAGMSLSLLCTFFFSHLYSKAVLKIPMFSYYRQAWLHLAWMAGLFGLLLMGLRLALPVLSLPALLALGALSVAAFWMCGYWILDDYEKKTVRHIFSKILPPPKEDL